MACSVDKPVGLTKYNDSGASVAFILLPEFTLSTFSSFVDVLRLASDSLDHSRQRIFHWTILGPDLIPIKSSCGVRIAPDRLFDEPTQYDYLIICGGLLKGHDVIPRAVFAYLKQAEQAACHLIGLCTGTFALAAAGLLCHQIACVHWAHALEFIARYPQLKVDSSRLYLTHGNMTTCSGGLASANLATSLVVKHCGLTLGHKVMSGLSIESFRNGRAPQQHKGAGWFNRIQNPSVRRAILLMESHINEALTTEDLYHALNISASTLERAFKEAVDCSPATFARMLRLAYGRWELFHSTKAITDIANDFGFSDGSHFSQWYKRVFGVTPKQDRAQGLTNNGKFNLAIKPSLRLPSVVEQMLAGELLVLDQDWLENQMPDKIPMHGMR